MCENIKRITVLKRISEGKKKILKCPFKSCKNNRYICEMMIKIQRILCEIKRFNLYKKINKIFSMNHMGYLI